MNNRRVTSDELRRMQIPALVKSGPQRMQVIVEPEPPCGVHRFAIFRALLRRERLAFARAMRTDRQNIGRAIGKMDAGAGERDQHHLPREIAGRMSHRLVARR